MTKNKIEQKQKQTKILQLGMSYSHCRNTNTNRKFGMKLKQGQKDTPKYRGTKIRITMDFSLKTMQVRRKLSELLVVLTERKKKNK